MRSNSRETKQELLKLLLLLLAATFNTQAAQIKT